MNKYAIARLSTLLPFLFVLSSGFGQVKPPATNSYCYYPQDKTKVGHTESLAFYVQSFNEKDVSLCEFVVLENGHPARNIGDYRFSVDAPSPNGNNIDAGMNNNGTFRLYIGSYLKGKNSINVYISRKPLNGEYAGPITFLSSNGTQNPDYADQCRLANREYDEPVEKQPANKGEKDKAVKDKPQMGYIDTGLLWNFRTAQTIPVKKSGAKTMVVREELLNTKIVPTKGMQTMIDNLNPKESGQYQYTVGAQLRLPEFKQPDKEQVRNMELQIQKDTSKDESQNQLIAIKAKNFSNMLRILEKLKAQGEYMDQLHKSELILKKIVFNLKTIKFKRYHAVMINTETEKLTNYILRMAAEDKLLQTNSSYIISFNKYIMDIINPYYYQKKSGNPTGFNATAGSSSGLMSANKLAFVSPGNFFAPSQDYLFSIHVFIPVRVSGTTSYDYKDSMGHYWVYVLDAFQYDNLNDAFIDMDPNDKNGLAADKLNKMITKSDLDGTGTRCDTRASITAKSFDIGRPYHFIVVSDDTGEIIIHDFTEDSAKILPHSPDKNIPELYGVGLCQSKPGSTK